MPKKKFDVQCVNCGRMATENEAKCYDYGYDEAGDIVHHNCEHKWVDKDKVKIVVVDEKK